MRVEEDIDADLVDDPVVGGAQLQEAHAQVRVGGQRGDGPLDQVAASLVGIGRTVEHCRLGVGVDGVHEGADEVADRAASHIVQLGPLLGGELKLELGQP